MNQQTSSTYPILIIDIRRYDGDPETFRFFRLEPHEVSTMHMNYRPFQDRNVRGHDKSAQNYIEADRMQVLSEEAELHRRELGDQGFLKIPFKDAPLDLAYNITHSHAPIEFHGRLDARDDYEMARIAIWTNGRLQPEPETVAEKRPDLAGWGVIPGPQPQDYTS